MKKHTHLRKYELSQILKDEADRLGIEKTRDNLIFLLQEKHKLFGKRYLVDETLKKAGDSGIFTGLRDIKQIETLKEKKKNLLLF